jgi:Flp pilus assembly protein TadD
MAIDRNDSTPKELVDSTVFGVEKNITPAKSGGRLGVLAALTAAAAIAITGCRCNPEDDSPTAKCLQYEDDDTTAEIKCLDEVMAKEPNDTKAMVRKGVLLLSVPGNILEATKLFNMALMVNPNDSDATTGMGLISSMYGDERVAEFHFKRALEQNDGNSYAWNNLGLIYGKRGDHAEALKCFEEAVDHDEKNAEALDNLGVAYGMSGNHEKAMDCFGKALKIKPNNRRYLNNLEAARIRIEMNK